MDAISELIERNRAYAPAAPATPLEPQPRRRLAVVTCMDARIDVFAALGLRLGDAHVIRNAGARVTDDVLRSLALSVHGFGTDVVVLMQHTQCGLAGTTDAELRARTGADVEFLSIDDHTSAVTRDVEQLRATPYLSRLEVIAGLLYDVETALVTEIVRA